MPYPALQTQLLGPVLPGGDVVPEGQRLQLALYPPAAQ